MKRSLFFAAALLCGMAMFTACEDDETASALEIDMSKTAQMTGYVFADLDLTKAGNEIPTQAKVVAYVLNTQMSITTGSSTVPSGAVVWSDTVSVSADGSYVIDFPIGLTNSTVNIVPQAFIADQKQGYGTVDTEIKKVFSANATTSASLTSGATIPVIILGAETFAGDKQFTTISGKLYADLTELSVGEETLNGMTITFYSNGWMGTATTDSKGNYTISVPYGETISLAKFDYDYVVNATTVTAKVYTADSSIDANSAAATSGNNVTFYGVAKSN